MEQKSSLARPRKKARLRPRRKINWGPTLVILLLGNVAYACYNSRVTEVRNINLDGVRPSERLRLARVVQDIKGKPALKIDPRVVESAFMNESRVKSADFRRNIFGVARLIVHYRTPVAAILGSAQTFLDEHGVVFVDREEKGIYPQIKLQSKIKVSVVALSGVINYTSIGKLAKLAESELKEVITSGVPIEIEVQETGAVCLNISNGTVDLGTCEQLPQKIEKLKQVLREQPDIFEVNSSINLMVPENPQRVPRKKENG